jgi:hypothetical protein
VYRRSPDAHATARRIIEANALAGDVDWALVEAAVRERAGIARDVTSTQRLVDTQCERAKRLLAEHGAALDVLVTRLLEAETLDGSAVRMALERTAAAEQAERLLAWGCPRPRQVPT